MTGDVPALGGWNTDLALPLDPAAQPAWTTVVRLPSSRTLQYKYFRKNDDGTITRENVPGGGNRSFTTPVSGASTRTDTVSW